MILTTKTKYVDKDEAAKELGGDGGGGGGGGGDGNEHNKGQT